MDAMPRGRFEQFTLQTYESSLETRTIHRNSPRPREGCGMYEALVSESAKWQTFFTGDLPEGLDSGSMQPGIRKACSPLFAPLSTGHRETSMLSRF